MVRPGRELLNGTVEVDETYIGATEPGAPGRGTFKKELAVIAIELRGNKLGRARMRLIDAPTGANLIPFVKENVESGSEIITDGWSGYSKLSGLGYTHTVKVVSKDKEALNHVHLVISLLKRWLLGTLQGAPNVDYLEYYLDEYVFRFNRRNSGSRGLLFQRLIELAVTTPPITRGEITGGKQK
jgi:hypothetical protein